MAELRKRSRRHTDTLFCVYTRNDDQFVGCLVDMTIEGVKLRTMAPMETDAIFQFRMDLPEKIGGSAVISFDAESVWCKECADSPEYHVGFRMKNVPRAESERIEQLINGPLFKEANAVVHITVSKKTTQ